MDADTTIDPTGFIKSRGLKFPKDGTYLTGKVRGLLRANAYEQALSTAALKATRAQDVVLDIGCGLGFVSGMLAQRRKVSAVHGYDGNATLLTYAEAMLATNGITNVILNHAVLGKENATVPFYVRMPFAASSLTLGEGEDASATMVKMHDFNATLMALKPTVIICDIEGGEADLLSDADLTGVRQLVVKLHPGPLGHQGLRHLFDSVSAAGLAYDPRISAGRIVAFAAG